MYHTQKISSVINSLKCIFLALYLVFGGFSFSNAQKDSARIDYLSSVLDSIRLDLDTIKNTIKENPEILVKSTSTKGSMGQVMFEDKKGESAIFYPSGGILRFNYNDASFKFGYLKNLTNKRTYLGADLTGKISDKKGFIFKEGKLFPGAALALNFGLKEFSNSIFEKVNEIRKCEGKSYLYDGWLNFELKYNYLDYEVLNPSGNLDHLIIDDVSHQFSALAKLNIKFGPSIWAVSSGFQQSNNLDDLKDVEFAYVNQIPDTVNNRTITYSETKTIKLGEFEKFATVPIYADIFWFTPKQPRLAYYYYYRGKFSGNDYKSAIGTGLYLQKKGNPLNSIGGIVFELGNLQNHNEKDFLKNNFSINLVIGYSFGK